MAKASILVTGGAGFIGSHVAMRLQAKGFEVVVLDDLSGGFRENLPSSIEFIEGSILDLSLLQSLFEKKNFYAVYHLAAYAAEGLSHFIRTFNYQHNLVGSIHLINLSIKHRVKRFVFTSSIAVYGKNQLPMSESMVPQPEDPYGISKYAVELDLKSAAEMFGLEYTVFRPHNVYGENQNIGDRYRNVIGIFMNQIMQGQPLTIFGDGTQTRAFSYIDDVAIPMVECLEMPETVGEVFNVGADIPYSVKELAQAVMKSMGKTVDIKFLEKRNEVEHAYADHNKVKKFFPNLPKSVTLDDGLSKMATWALKNGPRKTKLFMNIELWQNMPALWKTEFEGQKKQF